MGPCKSITDTLAPVERTTDWALPAWDSTLVQNDVPSALLYGQDHLWATSHLVSSPGGFTQEFKFIFLIQRLIATLNSYAHTVSPMARLKWSAFLRGVFGAL